jgi:purine-binding chemotaxis protein CheW
MEKDIQVVGFRIGSETFGVHISHVREIVRVPEITAVPNAPNCLEGVINLRGKIIPVIDLRKRFGVRDIQPDKKNRILVVEYDSRLVGLIVRSASEVIKIPPSDIEASGALLQEGEVGYVTGVGKLNGRLIILIDLNKLLQKGEWNRLEETAELVVNGH